MSAPRARPLSDAQRRNRDTDPDAHHHRAPTAIHPESVIIVPHQAQRGRGKQTEASRLAEGLIEAAGIVAAPRAVGADDVALAMEDIERRYRGTLEIDDLFSCSEYLCNNFVKAVVYLRAGPALKARYVQEWKKVPGEGQGFLWPVDSNKLTQIHDFLCISGPFCIR